MAATLAPPKSRTAQRARPPSCEPSPSRSRTHPGCAALLYCAEPAGKPSADSGARWPALSTAHLDGILLAVEVLGAQLVVLVLLQQPQPFTVAPEDDVSERRCGHPARRWTYGCARSLCVRLFTALRREVILGSKRQARAQARGWMDFGRKNRTFDRAMKRGLAHCQLTCSNYVLVHLASAQVQRQYCHQRR